MRLARYHRACQLRQRLSQVQPTVDETVRGFCLVDPMKNVGKPQGQMELIPRGRNEHRA